MKGPVAIAGLVALICGAVAGVAAIAIAGGWSTASWLEDVALVCAVIFVAAAGGIAITAIVALLLRAAAYLIAPEQPPALIRIAVIIEAHQTERRASGPGRREPPPANRVPRTRLRRGESSV